MPPKDDRATARIGNTTNMHKQKNPQTDCATRSVNQNLVNYCTTVGTSCTTNPEQTAVVELQVYSRPTCNKLYVSNNDASTVVWCDPPARPSTSFVDNAIDLPWPNFQCDGDVPLFFGGRPTRIFLLHSVSYDVSRAKNHLDPFFRFNRTPTFDWRTQTQTGTEPWNILSGRIKSSAKFGEDWTCKEIVICQVVNCNLMCYCQANWRDAAKKCAFVR